jgi:hypothetical protein
MGEADEQIKQLEEEIQRNEQKKKFRETMVRSNRYLVPIYAALASTATYMLTTSDLPLGAAVIAGMGFPAIPVLVWWTQSQDFKQGVKDIETINEGNRYFVQYLKKDARSYRS